MTDSCGPETRDVTASTSESTSGLSDYAHVMLTQDRGGPGSFYWHIQGPAFLSERWIHTPTRNMSLRHLGTMEEQLKLELDGDGRGHVTCRGEARDVAGTGNVLRFELALDQTQLSERWWSSRSC